MFRALSRREDLHEGFSHPLIGQDPPNGLGFTSMQLAVGFHPKRARVCSVTSAGLHIKDHSALGWSKFQSALNREAK
ncbi:hypothetical protein A4249_14110 [Brevundimonas sp. GW460-12-10-14-LB2]|uniref:hypothetical protein n=1 Tax=Brevundimonas sp. GW460-12-10-14-LB2 TaxID=1827469 RepID=UPI0007BCCCCF|nr:hypothetical protein [Brevundimonas sp. GW460-12-10-14-LB2]ANC54676.1 hypothetical protein A4249_14110 [Brevundimonas sp. GW460-12-10-14-LB2]